MQYCSIVSLHLIISLCLCEAVSFWQSKTQRDLLDQAEQLNNQ